MPSQPSSTAGLSIATPIPLADMPAYEADIDWDEVYGRYGTATHVFPDYYNTPTPPEHLRGKATHVWLYWQP